MAVISSAEAQKSFGRYREQALEEPVVVTQYGKPSVVILSASEYERLKEHLAQRYPTDRDAYTHGKAEFVSNALSRRAV